MFRNGALITCALQACPFAQHPRCKKAYIAGLCYAFYALMLNKIPALQMHKLSNPRSLVRLRLAGGVAIMAKVLIFSALLIL